MKEDISYIKSIKYTEQQGCCAACNIPFKVGDKLELAHILPQRNWIIAKYGKEIIHHELNMKLTHSGDCNAAVQMSPNKTKLVEAHVAKIQQAIDLESDLG